MLPLVVTLVGCAPDNDIKTLKPNILVSPEVLDFGQVVEDYSMPLNAEVINGGQGILEIDGVTIEGEGADAFTVAEIAPEIPHDSSWPLQVTFTPDNPLTYTATLNIASNDADTPSIAISLTGQGIETPTPDIECDPLTLDYGTVAPGGFSTLWTTCTNVGDADLVITSWSQRDSGFFQLASDPTGYVLPPDQSLQLIVIYSPTSEVGDHGTITLNTNDPDESALDITLIGNGGGEGFDYPVAVITGPDTTEPRSTITLSGAESDDPGGHKPLTYEWTVIGPYESVEFDTIPEVPSDIWAQLDLAGDYRVTLQVRNSIGVLSAPAVHTVSAIPTENFHVELVWNDLPDLDLHLMTSEGELFVEPYDCNYCNQNPEWGAIGAGDNPTLDIDSLSTPPGLENINIESPADDTYHVKVHYYEENGGGDATATVNIYLYGSLAASYSRVLQRNKVWDVAQVVWPEGYVVEEETDLYTPGPRTCTE